MAEGGASSRVAVIEIIAKLPGGSSTKAEVKCAEAQGKAVGLPRIVRSHLGGPIGPG